MTPSHEIGSTRPRHADTGTTTEASPCPARSKPSTLPATDAGTASDQTPMVAGPPYRLVLGHVRDGLFYRSLGPEAREERHAIELMDADHPEVE